ncbi:unnamed protein product, partial [Rotaria magnacalcarata]
STDNWEGKPQAYHRIPRFFFHVNPACLKPLQPLKGYTGEPLPTLREAVAPVTNLLADLELAVSEAMNISEHPPEGITQNESAAIRLYTRDWNSDESSLYAILNETLRLENREKLKPWHSYVKLLLTALFKLPPIYTTVWCSVKGNLDLQYNIGDHIIWWAFSSCTTSLDILSRSEFLDTSDTRTIFEIECIDGRNIQQHSFFEQENELLLLPCRYFEVIGKREDERDPHIIQLRQKLPPITLLEPPFRISADQSEVDATDNSFMRLITPGKRESYELISSKIKARFSENHSERAKKSYLK